MVLRAVLLLSPVSVGLLSNRTSATSAETANSKRPVPAAPAGQAKVMERSVLAPAASAPEVATL